MRYLDRSPGAFIVLANLVVYGVIGVEIWMWTVASVAAVAVTLALIAVVAGVICHSAVSLMDDGISVPAHAAEPTGDLVAAAAVAAVRPVRSARPVTPHVA